MIENNIKNQTTITSITTTETKQQQQQSSSSLQSQQVSIEFYKIAESKFKFQSKFIDNLVNNENINQELLLNIINQYNNKSMDLIKSLIIISNTLVQYNNIIFSKVLNIIWRIINGNGNNTNDKQYNQFIESLFGIIENEYGEPLNASFQFEKLINHLTNSISNYYNLIREFNNNSNNLNVLRIYEVFQILDRFIESSIENFREYGYEFNYLCYFTLFSTTHLMLLSEFIRNGERKWNFNIDIINEYKNKFKKNIQEYTDHCNNVYQNEVKNMKYTHPQYPSGFSKLYFNIREMIRVREEWNYYNSLRNNVYSKVFDYVSLWEVLDLSNSNLNNSNGSFKEPTRVLLSNCYGAWYKEIGNENSYNSKSSIDDVENEINNRGYNCYTNQLLQLNIYNCSRLDSIQTVHNNILSTEENKDTIESDKVGGSGGNIKTVSINNNDNNQITSVDVAYDMVPYKLIVDGNSFGDNAHDQIWSKASIYGYKVSNFYGFGENKISGFNSLDCLLISFIPSYINDINYVYPNIATFISSLKSIQTSNSSNNNNVKSITSLYKTGYQFNSNQFKYYKFNLVTLDNNQTSIESSTSFKLTLDIDYINDSSYLKIYNYSTSPNSNNVQDDEDGATSNCLTFTKSNNSNIIQLNHDNNNNIFTILGNNIKLYNFIFNPLK